MTSPAHFLNGRVALYAGDCLDVLKTLADNSVDSVVTDPPYHLTSIVKRFSKMGANDKKLTMGRVNPYQRTAVGFMQKEWDGGDVAFRVEVWAEALRVLKPGGHLVAFGGTRTYHRVACAIEDAGFEIRDQLAWVYGQGFPKSHDVSKGIDNHKFAEWLDSDPSRLAAYRREIDAAKGDEKTHVERKYRKAAGVWREIISSKKRNGNPICTHGKDLNRRPWMDAQIAEHGHLVDTITAPATQDAIQWKGWGTALKPSWEPICLARKPLSERTVAANVLRWGTGAINVDSCRVSSGEHSSYDSNGSTGQVHIIDQNSHIPCTSHPETSFVLPAHHNGHPANVDAHVRVHQSPVNSEGDCRPLYHSDDGHLHLAKEVGQAVSPLPRDEPGPASRCASAQDNHERLSTSKNYTTPDIKRKGRWPANLVHDGSKEVMAAFPETSSGTLKTHHKLSESANNCTSGRNYARSPSQDFVGDSGSAARFFYSAKADADDRLGSKHPTVKPVDLMQWLVRLVTPKGGTTLDPFAGTGTTGQAAWREGMRAVLIEREDEYRKDIGRRMRLCLSGPGERAREGAKARQGDAPLDYGPLFVERS